jgi:hypothetical protein
MTRLAELIDEVRIGPRTIEGHLLGAIDSAEISSRIEAMVSAELGAIEIALFYKTSVGIVVGFRMASQLEVVVKIISWGVSEDRLLEIHKVQNYLANAALAAPRSLFGPVRLGNGFAFIEEMRAGNEGDGFDEDVRRNVAFGLRRFVNAAQPMVGRVNVGRPLVLRNDYKSLWPEPHDLNFDFQATTDGAQWIDEYGVQARQALNGATGELALGHFDWRVQNLAFREKEIVAIYDWDSVGLAPEAVIVGCAAASFSSTWVRRDVDTLPTVQLMRSFVEFYEEARGKSFDDGERELIDAANLWLCAYGARCQHSNLVLGIGPKTAGSSSWIRLLRERGSNAFR